MLTVGIVGQIATGKTTVTDEFVRLGAIIISGDKIGKEVVDSRLVVRKRLVAEFGDDILNEDNSINRRALAQKAFASPDALEKLNKIVHPPLLRELRRQIKSAQKSSAAPMLVVDAALIFEWGLEAELDVTILVDAPRHLQLKWIEQKGHHRKDALKRIRLQMPKYRQRELADRVIYNDGSKQDLRDTARRLYQSLVSVTEGQN